MQAVTVHQHFRCLRTFFRWAVEAELLPYSPLRNLSMRTPKTLPRVPEDEAVQRLLDACPDTFEGRRNRALVSLLSDSGLRISEALRLRIEDVRFAERTLTIRGGKGAKDGIGHFGAETAHTLRSWINSRHDATTEDYRFVDTQGRPLSQNYGSHLLHRPLGPGWSGPQDRPPRPAPLCGHQHSQANRRPGVSPTGPAPRVFVDGASLRATDHPLFGR